MNDFPGEKITKAYDLDFKMMDIVEKEFIGLVEVLHLVLSGEFRGWYKGSFIRKSIVVLLIISFWQKQKTTTLRIIPLFVKKCETSLLIIRT
ncbi:hypothetical protein [Bacillus sp. FSL K6-3431]|uniref:hypothetical protein n=1 Tax=Bacillus sp. FSL K6-3431 TaxID=2921500 RepID=UPI0030F590EF